MALEGTVKLPVFGAVRKQTALITGVSSIALVLGIYWYRAHKAAAAASTAAASGTGTVTDPAGNQCASLNPATGYCPGTSADQQALAQLDQLGTAYDTSGLGTGLSGYYYGPGGSAQLTPPGPGAFADNAEWAQYVEAYMTGILGGDPATVAAAIGAYISGAPVTAAQQSLIQEAIAYGGQPPQPGTNGDPPGINLESTNTGTGTTGPGPGTGPAGPGTGSTGIGPGGPGAGTTPPKAAAPPPVAGLHATSVSATAIGLAWNASAGAKQYQVRVTYQSQVTQTHMVTGTSYTVTGLTADHTYGLHVVAISGASWAPEASISVQTSK